MKLSWATSFSVPSFLALIFGTGVNLLCYTGHCLSVNSLKPLRLNHVITSARVIKSKVSTLWGGEVSMNNTHNTKFFLSFV